MESQRAQRRNIKTMQIVQKFIKSNAKAIEISPFEYKGVEPNSSGSNLDNFDWDNAFSNPIIT